MNYLLIARQRDHSILVEEGNRLPTIAYRGGVTHFIGEVSDHIRNNLNSHIKLNFLRHEGFSRVDPLIVFEVPNDDVSETPKNCKWVMQSAADEIAVHPPSKTITAYLEKYKLRGLNMEGEKLHPFSRAGWLERASVWITKTLNDNGHKVESIEKLQHGLGSCVVRAIVSSGLVFYMKCSNPKGWLNEVRVTQALGEVMPTEFETPIAVDLDLGWMLTRDYGQTLPDSLFETDVELAKRVLCAWAEIQKKSVSKVEELQKRGVPIVDGKAMKAAIDRAMENPAWFKAQRDGMNEEQLERYTDECEYKNEYRAYLQRLFDKVAEYKVPLAIVHGDLESVNVIVRGDQRFTFIDMFYTQISFPFLEVNLFPLICGSTFQEFDLDFYLEHWTEYESMDRLRELLVLVKEVGSVESAISAVLDFEEGEEREKEQHYREMRFPVCRKFGYHED